MTEKRFKMIKSEITGRYVIIDEMKDYAFYGFEDEFVCMEFINALNDLFEKAVANSKLTSKYLEENEQLKKKNQGLENDFLNKLNEQHDRNERLKSINYQLSARCHDYEKSLYNGRKYLKKLNEKFEKIFGISLENFLDIEYKR